MTCGQRAFFIVDAFTTRPFCGNPAAVIPGASGLTDEVMQSLAAEFNLSETTFILPVEPASGTGAADVRFRWFTPTMEMDVCGHATIAGVHVMVETGLLAEPSDVATSTTLRIATRSGVLTAFVEKIPGGGGRMIWLDLIPVELAETSLDRSELACALGLEVDAFDETLPAARTPTGVGLVFVRDTVVLNEARPDFARLEAFLRKAKLWGLSLATVHTLTPSAHLQSRFFAPSVGINEDPVKGSVHGALAAYLVQHGRAPIVDGLAGLTCIQGVPGGRTGLLYALVQQRDDGWYYVRIGGQAVSVMSGTLSV